MGIGVAEPGMIGFTLSEIWHLLTQTRPACRRRRRPCLVLVMLPTAWCDHRGARSDPVARGKNKDLLTSETGIACNQYMRIFLGLSIMGMIFAGGCDTG